ncbi:MAG: histidine phosphatase family protein [Lachnospiraceae bacterium]|nr:histidine phosphatase family protein [Lachnospiraceae bacterium]
MKLIFIRHGEPDYIHDSLTEKGFREAEILSDRVAKMDIDEIYVSPLGRAQATAAPSLKKINRTAITLPWLREFSPKVHRPDSPDREHVAWDWLPQDWTVRPEFYDPKHWFEHPAFKEAGVKEEYEYVISSFDKFLTDHGYTKEGNLFKVSQSNNDTIVIFCHFGLTALLLSYLTNISPMAVWHGTITTPTSVTTVVTEERREGIASFRVISMGDVSHLYAAGEEPSFSGRFCESYYNTDQRRD